LVTIDSALAATAHASDHATSAYGSKIIAYLEFFTPICLFTVQVILGYDDD